MARQKVLTGSLGNCELPAWINAPNSGGGRARFRKLLFPCSEPVRGIADTPHSNFAFAFARDEGSLSRYKQGCSSTSLFHGSRDLLPKEKSNMKKRSRILMVVFLTCFPLGAQAGQNTSAAHDQASAARKASRKATSIPGKVGSDGRTFTADKNNRIWMVSNPEALSGIDGRH